jgi:subtilase family serine protease
MIAFSLGILFPMSSWSQDAACTYPDGSHPSPPELHCYDPATFASAYGIDRLHAAGITGKGQTLMIGVAYGSPTIQADLDHFSDVFRLPRKTIQFLYPDGKYTNSLRQDPPGDPSQLDGNKMGAAKETTLDVETAHAVAPDADIVLIVTSVLESEGMAGFANLFHGISMAQAQYPSGIVSLSLGTGENTFTPPQIQQYLQGSYHQEMTNWTQAGMTILAAAGDFGTAVADVNGNLTGTRAVNYPASDPVVTAVGGTALEYGWIWDPKESVADFMNCLLPTVNMAEPAQDQAQAACQNDLLNWISAPGSRIETAWKEDWDIGAGGGGSSSIFAMPDYQQALPEALLSQIAGHRAIPDLSMNAAVDGALMLYRGFQVSAGNPSMVWGSDGGTSSATPQMAGIVALAAQRASEILGRPGTPVGMGAINELIYRLGPEDFHDILPHSFGNNGQVSIADNSAYFSSVALQIFGNGGETPSQVPGYPVTPGFDLATGFGSPIADRFVEDLAQARVKH